MKNIKRGNYNEINLGQLPKRTQKQVNNLVYAASQAEKIDEHGNWEFGFEGDSKGRWAAWHL